MINPSTRILCTIINTQTKTNRMSSAKTNVFAPTSGIKQGKQSTLVKSAISSAIPVPVLPDTMLTADRIRFLSAMTAIGTSESTAVSAWKTYILAYTAALFPSLVPLFNRSVYAPVQISPDHIKDVLAKFDNLESIEEGTDEDTETDQEREFNELTIIPGAPKTDADALTRHLICETHPKIIAAHYSLLLFMAGKRIDSGDHTPITKNRPDALIRKAHLDFEPVILTGSLRFSDASHNAINSAWQELAALRSICFRTFAEYEAEATDDIQDMIFTTMHLLKFSGMQHAKIIHDFLKAYPWAREVPALRTAIAKYDESIVAVAGYPVIVQPYVKIIYGDKATVFPRKEMEVVISCAVQAAQEVSPDIVNFYTSSAFTPIVDAFIEERARRANIRTLKVNAEEDALLKKLGVVAKPAAEEEEYDEDNEEYDEEQ